MTAPETPRPTAQGEGVAGGATNYNERNVVAALPTGTTVPVNEAQLLDHLLAVEQQRAMRLDEFEHADRCSDLASRLNGAVPAKLVEGAIPVGAS